MYPVYICSSTVGNEDGTFNYEKYIKLLYSHRDQSCMLYLTAKRIKKIEPVDCFTVRVSSEDSEIDHDVWVQQYKEANARYLAEKHKYDILYRELEDWERQDIQRNAYVMLLRRNLRKSKKSFRYFLKHLKTIIALFYLTGFEFHYKNRFKEEMDTADNVAYDPKHYRTTDYTQSVILLCS